MVVEKGRCWRPRKGFCGRVRGRAPGRGPWAGSVRIASGGSGVGPVAGSVEVGFAGRVKHVATRVVLRVVRGGLVGGPPFGTRLGSQKNFENFEILDFSKFSKKN